MNNFLRQVMAALSIIVLGIAFGASVAAIGAAPDETKSSETSAREKTPTLIREALRKSFPRARIEVDTSFRSLEGQLPTHVDTVETLQDNLRGDLQVELRGTDGNGDPAEAKAWIRYRAYQSAWVAVKRVLPGEALNSDSVAIRDVEVTSGMARQSQGLMLDQNIDINHLEARQTILEGGYALSSGVRRLPDIRRGDTVQIRLLSGDVILSTSGVAEESAYLDGQVRVITAKTKKNLIGRLMNDKTVEVRL